MERNKDKYFLGAVLPIASLAMQGINMLYQNAQQKKAVAENNKKTEELNNIQFNNKIEFDSKTGSNYAQTNPMYSFYANGGIKPISSSESIVIGNKHEKGGVDYKNVEVEGGEVIKHENGNDFIFSDRLKFDDKNTYADIATSFVKTKGNVEKEIGTILKINEETDNSLKKAGSIIEQGILSRNIEKNIQTLNVLDKTDKDLETSIEKLKEEQLIDGINKDLYNLDGTPKIKEFAFGGNEKSAITDLIGAGINLATNINTTNNLSKLKNINYMPLEARNLEEISYDTSKNDVIQNKNKLSDFVDENISNPQIALAMKNDIQAKSITQLSDIEQQEQNANTNIRNTNIQQQLQIDSINNQNLIAKEEKDLQKTIGDINNRATTAAAFTKDLGDVVTNYRQGELDSQRMNLYSKTFEQSVKDELELELKYGIDRSYLIQLKPEERESYLLSKNVSQTDIDKYLRKK